MRKASASLLILTAIIGTHLSRAAPATFGQTPKGQNPTLYAADDAIIQLDESSFNDTVYCDSTQETNNCTSLLVEFYSDWCGHCRSFAPLYRALARDVRGWAGIVRLAAINCADPLNEPSCRAQGVLFFPYIKFFSRNASAMHGEVDGGGTKLRPYQSVSEMRDQLTRSLLAEYDLSKYPDWPDFIPLGSVLTYGELWAGARPSARHMAIVFEQQTTSLVGAQLLLDLSSHIDSLQTRRAPASHPLVDALHITDFPSLVIFRRGERIPVLIGELRRLLLAEIEGFLHQEHEAASSPTALHSRKTTAAARNRTLECERQPELCRELYYVSESDMLKAMRYALVREVGRSGAPLSGGNLTALRSFVTALSEYFPRTTLLDGDAFNETILERSQRAGQVFHYLRKFLELRQEQQPDAPLPTEEWRREFERAEEAYGLPFPAAADWQHCRGSSAQFRGYTCGLWTTFHALTVQAYKQSLYAPTFEPLTVLSSIRDWVGSFFGCVHCREHFLRMTTQTYRMETQVKKAEDVFLYLWRAHNLVNVRLRGRDTEDPFFPKYQFPPAFLCPSCAIQGTSQLDPFETHNFFIHYYSSIRAYESPPAANSTAAATAAAEPATLARHRRMSPTSTSLRLSLL